MDCDDVYPEYVDGINTDEHYRLKCLTRQVIMPPNAFDMECPPLLVKRANGTDGMKFNQFHCPVNCKVSGWSGWPGCSKKCGSCAQGNTQFILVKLRDWGGRARHHSRGAAVKGWLMGP